MEELIKINNLTKEFQIKRPSGSRLGDFLLPKYRDFRALDNVSFSIQRGEIIGLLGPNGAGKTTLIKIMCGLLVPDSGTVTIDGILIEKQNLIAQRVGLMLGSTMIYHRLTGYDNLKFSAKLYNMNSYKERISELSKFLGLEEWLDTYVERYSHGMKCKLALARALIHDPDILFLDEPTLGLDVQISASIREKIIEMKKTVVLTTHYLKEAEEMCDRVVILHKGRIVDIGRPSDIRKLTAKDVVVLVGFENSQRDVITTLRKKEYVKDVYMAGPYLHVVLDDEKSLPLLLGDISHYKVNYIERYIPHLSDILSKTIEKE